MIQFKLTHIATISKFELHTINVIVKMCLFDQMTRNLKNFVVYRILNIKSIQKLQIKIIDFNLKL